MKLAICYQSYNSHTGKIAQRMAEVAKSLGTDVLVADVRQASASTAVKEADAIALGGPVHHGKHSKHLIRFVRSHQQELSNKPSFFFSVSLSAVDEGERGQKDAQHCVDRFLQNTGWRPVRTNTIAGAPPYRDYNFLLRWMMKRIVAKEGGDTDTSRNYEYTNWDEVVDFVRECLDEARSNAVAGTV